MADKINIDDLWDEEIPEVEAARAKAWLEEQDRCLEKLAALPGGPWVHWDPEDDYNPELDYAPDTYCEKPDIELPDTPVNEERWSKEGRPNWNE